MEFALLGNFGSAQRLFFARASHLCSGLFGVGLCRKIQPQAIDVYPCAMAGFLAIGGRPPDAVETPACDRRSEFRLFEIWDSDDRLGFQKLEMPAGWLPGLTIIR